MNDDNNNNGYSPESSISTNNEHNIFYNFNYMDPGLNTNNLQMYNDINQNNLFFDINALNNISFNISSINDANLQPYASITYTPYTIPYTSVNIEPIVENEMYTNTDLQLSNRLTPPLFQELDNFITDPIIQNTSNIYSNDNTNTNPAGTEAIDYMYSTSGLDLMSILAKVMNRKSPQIQLGPVDMSCAFLVVDALSFDFPIIYASQSFTELTGYLNNEVVGRNCRFLQSPFGQVTLGSRRKYTDNNSVYQVKSQISNAKESQVSLVNYKKNGKPFINLMSLIPIALNDRDISYYVGFQVDMVEQPNVIMSRMKDGTYSVNYSRMCLPVPNSHFNFTLNNSCLEADNDSLYYAILGKNKDETSTDNDWHLKLLEASPDFKFVLTLKGIFLYASPNSNQMFGYDSNTLLTTNISAICHPDDVVPIMRELKEASTVDEDTNISPNFNLTFRVKKPDNSYIWLEALGTMSIDSAKGRRCIILNGKLRNSYNLSRSTLSLASTTSGFDSLDDNDSFWVKLSNEGLILYCTTNCKNVAGFAAEDLIGTSFYSLVKADKTAALSKALTYAQQQTIVRLRHRILLKPGFKSNNNMNDFAYNSNNNEPIMANVFSFFYPANGDLTNEVNQQLPYLLCQVRLLRKEPTQINASLDGLTQIKFNSSTLEEGLVTLSSSGNIYEQSSPQSITETNLKLKFGNENSTSQLYDNLLPYLDANLVEESYIDKRLTSTWQYELHRLQTLNSQLKQTVNLLESSLLSHSVNTSLPYHRSPSIQSFNLDSDDFIHPTNTTTVTTNKKRKVDLTQVNFKTLINQALQLDVTSNSGRSSVTICTQCHKTKTPEWRRGPLGPKTLCNSCGIKYAKKLSKK